MVGRMTGARRFRSCSIFQRGAAYLHELCHIVRLYCQTGTLMSVCLRLLHRKEVGSPRQRLLPPFYRWPW